MRFPVAVAGALLIHAAIAVAAVRVHARHLVRANDPTVAVEIEALPRPVETLEQRDVPLPIAAHASPRRGAPSQEKILAVTTEASSRDVVPDVPVDKPTPFHFSMTLGGEAGGTTKAKSEGSPDRVFSESEVTDRATLLAGPKPTYPPAALADGIELDAPLAFEIVVDTDGVVDSARPLGHVGNGFDEAALVALRAFRFTPAKRDGALVRVRMRWTVDFKLKD